MDKASADTYWDYFRVLEECLAHWTTPAKVRAGWQMAGTWPIDKDQILSSCSKWALLTDEQSRAKIRNVLDYPALQNLAIRGYIHDSELDTIISEPLAGIIDIDPATQKPDGVATSHSRCIHLTNNEYRNLMLARQAQQTEAEVARLAAEYERFANAEQREHAEERREISRQQIAAAESSTTIDGQLVVGAKRKRMTVVTYSNPYCKATCYKDDSANKNTWTYCCSTPKKKCKLIFCPADSCREMLVAHKEVCK